MSDNNNPGDVQLPDPDNYNGLPAVASGGLKRYLENRIPTGSFLQAVLENDLYAACRRADLGSRADLPLICAWIITYAPPACYGSTDKVAAWLKGGDDEAKPTSQG